MRAGHRTALLDAIYYGLAKMKDAHHERKALLVVSDGGDNRSRYTEGEVRAEVREADVEIYSIGIFDPYAPTPEERTGPQLLDDISSATGGRLFRVDDVDEMSDIAEKISTELRNQYVIGYKPKDLARDGKWRKVKVKVNPPPGLPPLTVYARTGYYAPLHNSGFCRSSLFASGLLLAPCVSPHQHGCSMPASAQPRTPAAQSPSLTQDTDPVRSPDTTAPVRPPEPSAKQGRATCCTPTWKKWCSTPPCSTARSWSRT